MSIQNGWAIDPNSKEGHGLIGVYWWFDGKMPLKPPPSYSGYRTAFFETRAAARHALKSVRQTEYGFSKARVVRVKVEVSIRDQEPKHE